MGLVPARRFKCNVHFGMFHNGTWCTDYAEAESSHSPALDVLVEFIIMHDGITLCLDLLQKCQC